MIWRDKHACRSCIVPWKNLSPVPQCGRIGCANLIGHVNTIQLYDRLKWSGVPRTQKLSFSLSPPPTPYPLQIQSYQRWLFKVLNRPERALYAKPAVKNDVFLISAFPVHSTIFPPNPLFNAEPHMSWTVGRNRNCLLMKCASYV